MNGGRPLGEGFIATTDNHHYNIQYSYNCQFEADVQEMCDAVTFSNHDIL